MIGKRKREEDDDQTAVTPLTKQNLAVLESSTLEAVPPVAQQRESSSASSSTRSNTSQSDAIDYMSQILETYRIFLDHSEPQPRELRDLIELITTPRDDPCTTPKSKKVARLWKQTKEKQEKDAIAALEQLFGYRPELWEDGEEGIERGQDLHWRAGSVPTPKAAEDDKLLQRAMDQLGAPKTPIPDICYGYKKTMFDEQTMKALRGLDISCFVAGVATEPILPFFIMEWKANSTGGTLAQAQHQVMRDGAAAVNAMTNFFKVTTESAANGDALMPLVAADKSSVFSLCIDSNVMELRVHWRRVDDGGIITWEADLLDCGWLRREDDVFRIRSCILSILTWAKGPRLASIREACEQRRTNVTAAALPTPPSSRVARSSSTAGSARKRRCVDKAPLPA